MLKGSYWIHSQSKHNKLSQVLLITLGTPCWLISKSLWTMDLKNIHWTQERKPPLVATVETTSQWKPVYLLCLWALKSKNLWLEVRKRKLKIKKNMMQTTKQLPTFLSMFDCSCLDPWCRSTDLSYLPLVNSFREKFCVEQGAKMWSKHFSGRFL